MTILKPQNKKTYICRLWITPNMNILDKKLEENNILAQCCITLVPPTWYIDYIDKETTYSFESTRPIPLKKNFDEKYQIFSINLKLKGNISKKNIHKIVNNHNFNLTKNPHNLTINMLSVSHIYDYEYIKYGNYKCDRFNECYNLLKELIPTITIEQFLKLDDDGKYLLKKEKYHGDNNLYNDWIVNKPKDIIETKVIIRILASDIGNNMDNLINMIKEINELQKD